MFKVKGKASDQGYIEAAKGIARKTLVFGENTLFTEFKLTGGNALPRHSHKEEQTGYLVSGHIVLTIGGVAYNMLPGDSWVILSNVEHYAQIIDDSVAVEVFSPVRADYIPK